MVKVSIIMPVYNSEKFLKKAVESVLNQKFEDFELILVDDGSPDASGSICDEFAEKDSRVKLIHKKNGGICSARNAGLKIAKGEYVGFCDNDDLYLPNLIEDNYRLAKENDVDLMRYAKIKRLEKDDGRVWKIHAKIQDMFIEKKDFAKHYQNIRREDTIWTAFYRREIIEKYNIMFDERFKYGSEDLNFNLQFLLHCEKLGFNSKEYYSWTQRESHSTSRKFQRDYLKKNFINMNLEYRFMNECCEDRVDNVMKNTFLINLYVYPIVDYMAIASCDMSLNEKKAYLDSVRNHKLFDKQVKKSTLKTVKSNNIRLYITMKLFYERRFRSLIFLLNYGTVILGKFRFKK